MEENFYDILARRYDVLQSDMDCPAWAAYISSLINKYCETNSETKTICDLGCGTGSVDVPLAKLGYSVIGLDNAEEMLVEAASREGGEDVIWTMQDLTEFELPEKVDCFISVLDTLDHILDEDVLMEVFKKVYENLEDGGVFVFDVITLKHLEETFGDNVFFQDYEEFTLLWDNFYDEETMTNHAMLTFFEEEEEGLYRRYDGELTERFYPENFFIEAAKEAGLSHMVTLGELKNEAPSEDEERIFLVFRKNK